MNAFARLLLVLALPTAAIATHPAGAQESEAPAPGTLGPVVQRGTPPYEAKLLRLAEVMGSLQYLRTLCGEEETLWRETMEQLIATEAAGEPERQARLTASYNHGYRTFASVHTVCSDAAVAAETRYREEGQALSSEIVARYGN